MANTVSCRPIDEDHGTPLCQDCRGVTKFMYTHKRSFPTKVDNPGYTIVIEVVIGLLSTSLFMWVISIGGLGGQMDRRKAEVMCVCVCVVCRPICSERTNLDLIGLALVINIPPDHRRCCTFAMTHSYTTIQCWCSFETV